MELTKIEKVIVISAFAESLTEDELEKHIDKQSLEKLGVKLEQIYDHSTPKELRESATSVLNKFVSNLLEEE